MFSRRRRLGAVARLFGSPDGAATPPVPAPLTTMRGADLSFTLQLEAGGRTFSDGGTVAPVEQLLAARGANLVRLRLWVDPLAGTSDLDSVLTLARRANAVGCHIMLNLHYSDTWADPRHQAVPRAWAGRDVDGLVEAVGGYTRRVVAAFAAEGIPPAMVQVGNEISKGMLWPAGRVQHGDPREWDRLARLLDAGIRGVREAAPDARTVVHTDSGGDRDGCERFFGNLALRDVDFDVAAVSYYPWWHGPLADLGANLRNLAERFGRDVVVVETSYPWTLDAGGPAEPHVRASADLPEAERFPPTPAGQAAYFEELRATVGSVPGGAGLGFVAWEPAWMPELHVDEREPNRFANLTMFDRDGAALPSVGAFRP